MSDLFDLLPDEAEPTPTTILQTYSVMRGNWVTQNCCLKDKRAPSTKIHIWALSDGRTLVLTEKDRVLTSMETVRGSFDKVKRRYQRRFETMLRQLKASVH